MIELIKKGGDFMENEANKEIDEKEKNEFLAEVYRKLEEAEESVKNGEVYDAWEMLEEIKKKYNF